MWEICKIISRRLKPSSLNGLFRRSLVAMLVFSAKFAFAVNPIPAHLGRIAMCLQNPQQNTAAANRPTIYNPFRLFGTHIYYSVHPEHSAMLVRVPGTNQIYRLELQKAVEEAMMEWSAAIPGLTFSEASYYSGGIKKWYFDLDDDNPRINRTANALRYTPGGRHNATVTFFSKAFASLTTPDVYNALSAKMSLPTMQKYLDFVLRYTAKHEIGHLLGFEHTPSPNLDNPEDTEECPSIVWLGNLLNVPVGPPLMIETLTEYFDLMRNYHGVPLTIEHINIAPQEAAYARAMFNADCPVTPQMGNGTSNIRSDSKYINLGDCPVPLRMLNKATAAHSLLLD